MLLLADQVEWPQVTETSTRVKRVHTEMTKLEGDIWNDTISVFPNGSNTIYIIIA